MRGKLVVPCPSRSTILADMLQPSWSNAAYILNEVKNPVRTLKIAGPLAVTTCGLLYIFAAVVSVPLLRACWRTLGVVLRVVRGAWGGAERWFGRVRFLDLVCGVVFSIFECTKKGR